MTGGAGSRPRRLAGASPLLRNASMLLVSSVLLSGLGFVFWIVAARRYEEVDVGTASAVISASTLISGIAQLGLASILTRYLPSAGARTSRTVLAVYGIATAATLVLAVATVLVAGRVSATLDLLDQGWRWPLVFILGTVCWTVFSLQDSVLTGLRETHWVPLENALYALGRLALVVALAAGLPTEGIVLATLLPAALLIAPINAVVFARFIPRATEARGAEIPWTFADVRRLVLGNSIGNIASLISVFLLPIVVADVVGPVRAAYFYVAWTIGVGLALITSTIATSLVVEAAHDEARVADLARQSLRAVGRILVPMVLVVAVAAGPVLRLFGEAYAANATTLLRLLALSALPGAIATIGIGLSRVRHDGRRVAIVQVAVAAVGVGLAAALLPRYGIDGVGVAWLVSQLLAAALVARIVRSTLRAAAR